MERDENKEMEKRHGKGEKDGKRDKKRGEKKQGNMYSKESNRDFSRLVLTPKLSHVEPHQRLGPDAVTVAQERRHVDVQRAVRRRVGQELVYRRQRLRDCVGRAPGVAEEIEADFAGLLVSLLAWLSGDLVFFEGDGGKMAEKTMGWRTRSSEKRGGEEMEGGRQEKKTEERNKRKRGGR